MDFGESKNPNLEDLLRLGARTAKAGNKDNARVIFQKVLDADKRNERAWLWMAALADSSIERRRYLQTVLNINPNNATAQKQLKSLDQNVRKTESQSLRLGIFIVLILVIALIVLLGIVFIASRVITSAG
jgi:hypothetical protein